MREVSISGKWEKKPGNLLRNLVWYKSSADTCEVFLFAHALQRENLIKNEGDLQRQGRGILHVLSSSWMTVSILSEL